MLIDTSLPFGASLFSGLTLRNQSNFDALEQYVRFEFAAGYDFKYGLEFNGKMGMGIWKDNFMNGVNPPHLGLMKEISVNPAKDQLGKLLAVALDHL